MAQIRAWIWIGAVCAALAPPIATAQSAEEIEFATALLANFNPLSIEYNREVCGYIIQRPDGGLEATKMSWGSEASCATLPLPAGSNAISSWHTHAAWGRFYDSEVPSTIDVEGDMRFGVNGWVATPGGRLWFVNGETGVSHQVCGRDCLPSDPNFRPETSRPVAKEYTLESLRARFGE